MIFTSVSLQFYTLKPIQHLKYYKFTFRPRLTLGYIKTQIEVNQVWGFEMYQVMDEIQLGQLTVYYFKAYPTFKVNINL